MTRHTAVAAPNIRLDWPAPQVARITLDRGDDFNTLTFEMIESLARELDQAHQEGARVLILTGSGRAFCGGAHVKYFTDSDGPLAGNATAIRDDYVRPIIEVFRRLREKPFVTIAAINGYALGGGCELALWCDFRLMSRAAQIGLTEVRLGVVAAAGGLQLLAGIVGLPRALEIAVLGDRWSADEAARIGLVHAACEPDLLDEKALELARRLLLCSPASVAETRRAIYATQKGSFDAANEAALDALVTAVSEGEFVEGMTAFTQKRVPAFAREGRSVSEAGIK